MRRRGDTPVESDYADRADMMMVLADLDYILIRGSYDRQQADIRYSTTTECNMSQTTLRFIKCNMSQTTLRFIKCNMSQTTLRFIKCNMSHNSTLMYKCILSQKTVLYIKLM